MAVILPSNVANEIELAESGARTPVTPMEAALMVGIAQGNRKATQKAALFRAGKHWVALNNGVGKRGADAQAEQLARVA